MDLVKALMAYFKYRELSDARSRSVMDTPEKVEQVRKDVEEYNGKASEARDLINLEMERRL